jgi:hypothetical protein
MRDWPLIILSTAMLGIVSALIFALAWSASQAALSAYDPQPDITERYEHCRLVWGESEHFEHCMLGLQITPSSGIM